MNKRLTISILCFLLIGVIVSLSACSSQIVAGKYDKDWILGKTSSEIEERYGEFDLCNSSTQINENGNYYRTSCGYMTKQWSPYATAKDEFFMICFDEDGVAYEFKENYPRPGG